MAKAVQSNVVNVCNEDQSCSQPCPEGTMDYYVISENNFSDDDKAKLDGIEENAQRNVQTDWDATTGAAAILNKPDIPTKTSELINDSGFLNSHQDISGKLNKSDIVQSTGDATDKIISQKAVSDAIANFITKSVNDLTNYYLKSETYNRDEINNLLNAINQFAYEVVDSLPTASENTMNKIYLVPSSTATEQNVKDEFITILSSGTYSWEQIGSTTIDLTGYVTSSALNSALSTKQDTIADLANIRSGASAGSTAYQKPSSGIPASDLATAVQTSLGKADTALQTHQDISGKQDVISDLSTIRSGASKGATAVQPGDLATVATSGSYNDLANKPTIPTVNNATLTIQKNGTTVNSFTANASSNVTANITVPTKVSELTNDSGYLTSSSTLDATKLSGTASVNTTGSAAKLTTARTIGLGTAVTSTATSFDGASNITIPVNSVKESYLDWGGKVINNDVSPIGASLSDELSANRLAFLPSNAIDVEYSSDGGSTWLSYPVSDSQKQKLVTDYQFINIGYGDTINTNSKTRVIIHGRDANNSYVYCKPKKLLMFVGTAHHGLSVIIEAQKGSGTWQTIGDYVLEGNSGWNDIPLILPTFGAYDAYVTNNYWAIRLTFYYTSINSSTSNRANLQKIRLYASTIWVTPSTLAASGHMYTFDMAQNVTFPAKVTAPTFSGALSGNATSYLEFNTTNNAFHAVNCGFYADGNVSALGVYSSSDMRLKQDVHNLENVLESIKDIDVFKHGWKDKEGTTIGVSAQQMKETDFSCLVREKNDGYLDVEYSKLAAVAIKACQELLQKVESLEDEIKTLKQN